jgi:hypothetical protein
MSDDTYQHEVYPDLIHAARDASYVITSAGGIGTAVMIVAASLAFLRGGRLAPWLAWVSLVAGIITLALIMFIPYFVLVLWVLVTSILLFLREGSADPAA